MIWLLSFAPRHRPSLETNLSWKLYSTNLWLDTRKDLTLHFTLMKIILPFIIISCNESFSGVDCGRDERRLLDDLLKFYNSLERPVFNESEAVDLQLGLTLQQIIDVVSYHESIPLKKFSSCFYWKYFAWFPNSKLRTTSKGKTFK